MLIDTPKKVSEFKPEHWAKYYSAFYPVGSGPLGCMKVICQLIEYIAEKEGFLDVIKEEEKKFFVHTKQPKVRSW